MCGSSKQSKPPPPPPIPPTLPEAPQASGRVTVNKGDGDERRRAAAGRGGTILTGPRGLTTSANTDNATTLLGA